MTPTTVMNTPAGGCIQEKIEEQQKRLDAHVVEIIQWHFDPATGCPFWLKWAEQAGWDPRREVHGLADLAKFGHFQDEWLRGGPVRRWVPQAYGQRPVYVFETGGTTGIPKSRISIDDFRIDYELFSQTLPDEYFPKGSNWMMLGPSGPRRLRLAVEHLAHYRGGICFCVDLDPRWVIKLIKKGWMDHLKAYQDHVIDQAMNLLGPVTISNVFSRPPSFWKPWPIAWNRKVPVSDSPGSGVFSRVAPSSRPSGTALPERNCWTGFT